MWKLIFSDKREISVYNNYAEITIFAGFGTIIKKNNKINLILNKIFFKKKKMIRR